MSGTTFAAAVIDYFTSPLPPEAHIRDLKDRIKRCEATLRDLRAELAAAEDKRAESRDRIA